jgi:hypothetical protein
MTKKDVNELAMDTAVVLTHSTLQSEHWVDNCLLVDGQMSKSRFTDGSETVYAYDPIAKKSRAIFYNTQGQRTQMFDLLFDGELRPSKALIFQGLDASKPTHVIEFNYSEDGELLAPKFTVGNTAVFDANLMPIIGRARIDFIKHPLKAT